MLLSLLLACRDPSSAVVFGQIDVELGEEVPTALAVTWEAEEAGVTSIRWGQDGALDQSTPPRTNTPGAQRARVLGPKAGRPVELQLVTDTAQGEHYESEVFTVDMPQLPAELPALFTSGTPPEGWVVTGLVTQSTKWVVILDGDGDVVWYLQMGRKAALSSVEPAEGGGLWVMVDSIDPLTTDSMLQRVDADGVRLVELRAPTGHHDLAELPGGRLAWIAQQVITAEVDGAEQEIAPDLLQVTELATGQTEVRVDLGTVVDSFSPQCEHQLDESGIGGWDWFHTNSLVYLADTGQLAALSHWTDTLYFFDAETGALETTVGQEPADFPAADAEVWDHGHLSQAWDGGLLMFDNRRHNSAQPSRVSRWSWSEAGGLVQDWAFDEPQGRRVLLLGDADQLSEDEVLVTWSTLGAITVTSPAGEERWRLECEVGAGFSRSFYTTDLYALLEVP